jgi:hypothetical protein
VRKDVLRDGQRCANPQLASLPFGKWRQSRLCRRFQLLHFASKFQQYVTGRGKRDVSAAAIKELYTKVLLQGFDL